MRKKMKAWNTEKIKIKKKKIKYDTDEDKYKTKTWLSGLHDGLYLRSEGLISLFIYL